MNHARTLAGLVGGLLLLTGVTSPASAAIKMEIDWMKGDDHSHEPTQTEIDALVQMFACQGVELTVVVDDQIPHVDVMRCSDPGGESFFGCNGSNDTSGFASMKDQFFDRGSGWHYCIFGHNYQITDAVTSSSGLAELNGDDLVVTLGSFSGQTGTPFDKASTLAHELGHNLGLNHSASGFDGDFQVNYPSSMSYQYQLSGVRTNVECLGLADHTAKFKEIDYSHGRLPDLNETDLDERVGMGIQEVDWDCDGTEDSGTVQQGGMDTDRPWCATTDAPENRTFRDRDDWAHVVANARLPFDSRRGSKEIVTCVTREEVDAWAQLRLEDPTACPPAQPTLTIEPCELGIMIWVDAGVSSSGPEGRGSAPFKTMNDVLNGTPSRSVVYLQPGSYDDDASPVVLDERMTFSAPATAVVRPQ